MSEQTENKTVNNLSNEEKIEFLKAMFSTLEIDEQAVFTNWCHEEVEKGGAKYLGQKIDEVNGKMNEFIAKAYDQVTKGAKFVYDKGNEMFEKKDEMPKNNSAETGKDTFFD